MSLVPYTPKPMVVAAPKSYPVARRRYYYKRKSPGFSTYPRFIPRSLSFKRKNQVSTKTFWFKRNGQILSNLGGTNFTFWRTREINDTNTTPVGWPALKTLYDQYKVLAIKVKLFPANVGIEPDTVLLAAGGLFRGDAIVWSDQRYEPNAPADINQVINYASASMLNPRAPFTRTLYRPSGTPEWGDTQSQIPDSWDGAIQLLINNATPQQTGGTAPVLWYFTISYKILVRGRRQV